jgi:hypothetical protein
MQTIIRKILIMAVAAVLLHSCRPEKFEEIGATRNVPGTLAGTWKLTRVIQTDEDAKNKGFTYGQVNIQQMDITNLFPYTDFKLTLNMNGNAPSTFTTAPGNSPRIIRLAAGNWTFDDPQFPKVLTLANPTDTARITLGSYPTGASPVLKVTQERRDKLTNKLLISYSYEFTKQ